MQIGCCVPIAKYEQAVREGYDYVEFPGWEIASLSYSEVSALAEKIEAADVPCLRMNAYCKGLPAIVGPYADQEKTRIYAEDLMKKASRLHVTCVGVGSPSARILPEEFDLAEADLQCEEFFRITGTAAAAYGIDVLVEAVPYQLCNYLNETEQALNMVQRLDIDHVHMVLDLYNMEMQGESWDDVKRYIPWTRHVHISTRGEGIARCVYQSGDEEQCLRAFRTIVDAGYDGTVSLEADASELVDDAGRRALKIMREAYKHVESGEKK